MLWKFWGGRRSAAAEPDGSAAAPAFETTDLGPVTSAPVPVPVRGDVNVGRFRISDCDLGSYDENDWDSRRALFERHMPIQLVECTTRERYLDMCEFVGAFLFEFIKTERGRDADPVAPAKTQVALPLFDAEPVKAPPVSRDDDAEIARLFLADLRARCLMGRYSADDLRRLFIEHSTREGRLPAFTNSVAAALSRLPGVEKSRPRKAGDSKSRPRVWVIGSAPVRRVQAEQHTMTMLERMAA